MTGRLAAGRLVAGPLAAVAGPLVTGRLAAVREGRFQRSPALVDRAAGVLAAGARRGLRIPSRQS